MTELTLIAAMGLNRVIGVGNALPWRLPADFAHFRALTMGKPVIMGRTTHESIGRPLPGRTNIVLTREPHRQIKGCITAGSVDSALAATEGAAEAMIIGGSQIYTLFLPLATRMELTEVQFAPNGEACFPDFDEGEWSLANVRKHPADSENSHAMRFLSYQRRP